MLEGEDGSGHLQYRQYLLSLQACLVFLFLPAERQQRQDADNVSNAEDAESCPFKVFPGDRTLEPGSPSGPLGPPSACKEKSGMQTVRSLLKTQKRNR